MNGLRFVFGFDSNIKMKRFVPRQRRHSQPVQTFVAYIVKVSQTVMHRAVWIRFNGTFPHRRLVQVVLGWVTCSTSLPWNAMCGKEVLGATQSGSGQAVLLVLHSYEHLTASIVDMSIGVAP